MSVKKKLLFLVLFACIFGGWSCTKETVKKFPPKKVTYLVNGTNFKLNFIDSTSVFKRDQSFHDTFKYEFMRGPGTSIGISVFVQSPTDQIFSWDIYINDKLYANAFSEGGAYLTIPYD